MYLNPDNQTTIMPLGPHQLYVIDSTLPEPLFWVVIHDPRHQLISKLKKSQDLGMTQREKRS